MKSLVCITGAAGGLGKAFAVECASRGWDLFLTDVRETALASLAAGLSSAYGVDVVWKTCNLTEQDSRTELFEFIRSRDLRFRGLINIAGIDYEGPFPEKTWKGIRTILRLNVEATLEVTRVVLDFRRRGQPFRIINVASLAAFYPMPVKAMYAATKRFLLDFSIALREELRPIGGTVTVLCPAGLPTNTECIRAIRAQGILGRITVKNVGYVASKTVDHALKGHAVYIPGILNRVIRCLGGVVPPTVAARFIADRWRAACRKKEAMGGY